MKGLEALEKIKKLYKSYIDKIGLNANDIMGFDFSIVNIEKELKALEIIKKTLGKDYLMFLMDNHLKWKNITQEEYGLLKEVLK